MHQSMGGLIILNQVRAGLCTPGFLELLMSVAMRVCDCVCVCLSLCVSAPEAINN